MIDKKVSSTKEAVSDIFDGATVMIGGFGEAGSPIELIHAWLYYGKQGQVSFLDAPLTAMHEIGAVALCLGYVGTLSWVASSGRGRLIHHPMRAVGRMALTTYLGSTLIATFLMYWWGLGWFGSVSRVEQTGQWML